MKTTRIEIEKDRAKGMKFGSKIKAVIEGTISGIDSYEMMESAGGKKEKPQASISIKVSKVDISGGSSSPKEVFEKGMEKIKD